MLQAVLLCLHLLREVQDLGKEFAEPQEVPRFVETLKRLLLAQAMKLRASRIGTQRISPASGCHQGADPPERGVARTASRHPKNPEHFSRERAPALPTGRVIPASRRRTTGPNGNSRPLVIARKISFGSQSEQGLKMRARCLMSVLNTLNKQTENLFATFTRALDALTINPTRNLYQLLFNSS